MTKKIYRSAQGRQVDIGALQLQNENTRAVGNMNVNARGDLIDGWNRPINSRNQQVARQYARQTNVTSEPVQTQANAQPKAPRPPAPGQRRPPGLERPVKPLTQKSAAKVVPPEDFDDDFQRDNAAPVDPTAGGLAAAIARAQATRNNQRG